MEFRDRTVFETRRRRIYTPGPGGIIGDVGPERVAERRRRCLAGMMEAAEGAGNSETNALSSGSLSSFALFLSLPLAKSTPGKAKRHSAMRRRRGVSCTHTPPWPARAKKVTLCRRKHSEFVSNTTKLLDVTFVDKRARVLRVQRERNHRVY